MKTLQLKIECPDKILHKIRSILKKEISLIDIEGKKVSLISAEEIKEIGEAS